MRGKIGVLTLIIASAGLLFYGCDSTEDQPEEVPAMTYEPTVEPTIDEYPSFMPVDVSVFSYDSESGELTWAGTITIAKPITIIGEEEVVVDDIPYTKIRTEDFGEVYTYSIYMIPNGQMGVIYGDGAVEYRDPELLAATNTEVPSRTVVVVNPESQNGYYKVVGRNIAGDRIGPTWIKDDYVSTREADWYSAVMLNKATVDGVNEITARELLQSAHNEFPSSVFMSEINQALAALTPAPAADASDDEVITMVERSAVVNPSAQANLNVRSEPSTSSSIVAELEPGTSVRVDGYMGQTQVISGFEDHWYRISSPVNGWVFGAFIVMK